MEKKIKEYSYSHPYEPLIDPKNGKEVLVDVQDASIHFKIGRGKTVKAVRHCSFKIYKGETFGLVGESGYGKTPISRAILRINHLTSGKIIFHGMDISNKKENKLTKDQVMEVKKNIQMIFQDPAACLNDRANIDYIVSEGLYNFHMFKTEEERLKMVTDMLGRVGLLPEHLTRYPHEFSGGQRQRIGIARALVIKPELILADEPISALDVSIRAQVLNLLKKLQREENLTYLFIAHDLSIIRYISDRIAVMYRGQIVELGEAEELFNNPLHPYTKSLLAAIPVPDPNLEKNRKRYAYNPAIHDYSEEGPSFVEVSPDHFVLGNSKEIEKYKKILESKK